MVVVSQSKHWRLRIDNFSRCKKRVHTSTATLVGRGPRPKTVKLAGASKYVLSFGNVENNVLEEI